DALVIKHQGTFKVDRLAAVAEVKWKGKTFVVIKPSTYMKLRGKAMKYWMDKEKIPLERILVLVDDLVLPLTALRLRPSGSHAGHNGLKNIQEILGHNNYPRLRFGIGNDFPKGRQVEFVLGAWLKEEIPIVKDKILKSVELIESFATQGLERTMNTYNQ